MNFRELSKPNVSERNATHLVLSKYGMEVTEIQRMVSFNDQNFYIQVSKEHQNRYVDQISDSGYTLKIINTMKSSLVGHFESMHASLSHLRARGLRVPEPVKNLQGETWSLDQVPLLNEGSLRLGRNEQKKCGVHILKFLPGTPITRIEPTPDIFFQWGSLLAKFHHATQDLTCPSLRKKEIFYNLEHVPEILNFVEDLDEEKSKMVGRVLERFSSKIAANKTKIPKGFIHGDFNGHNILAQFTNDSYSVDGILDFEDMHHGPYVWDIGLMLAHSMLDCGGMVPFDAAGHVLAGYLSRRQLSELEMSLIKVCVECRLCQSSVLCAYSRRLDPGNSYVSLLSSEGDSKWTRLEELLSTSSGELLERWNIASRN